MRRQNGGAAVVLGALSARARATPRSRCTRPARSTTWSPPTRSAWASTWTSATSPSPACASSTAASTRRLTPARDRPRSPAAPAATWRTAPSAPPTAAAARRRRTSRRSRATPSRRSRRCAGATRDLDFRSARRRSRPASTRRRRAPCLVKVRDALDDRSLAFLAAATEIRARADGRSGVRLLWQVCQIPDFRKTLTDAHLHLLATIFGHLTTGRGVLPNDWVGDMIARLDRTDGDIDTLVTPHRPRPHLDLRRPTAPAGSTTPAHWQERAREVEDRLSDALHDRLTQRFVDRRTSALLRSLREHGEQRGPRRGRRRGGGRRAPGRPPQGPGVRAGAPGPQRRPAAATGRGPPSGEAGPPRPI